MTIKEIYEIIGADYSATLMRMGNSERILEKFVRKFPNDKTTEQLVAAFDGKDFETAFRMAHTLKGLCSNLGLVKLEKSASALTEALRNQVADNAAQLLEQVRSDHAEVISALEKLDT